MSSYSIINLKTDPQLKKQAAKTADKLGISLSAVLNNELRRFTKEQSVTFDIPQAPNKVTAANIAASKKQINKGEYNKFDSNESALDFLAQQLKWKLLTPKIS